MPRALPPLAVLAALALALTGCAPASKGVAPEPSAVAAPFASEEEALAAAVEVYDRLTVLGDEIARAAGEGAERLEEVATGEFLETSVEGFLAYPERGVRQVGTTVFRDAKLQQFSLGPENAVTMYVCLDVSDVDIVDRSGVSVVSPDRPETLYLLVAFDLGADDQLRVSKWERWDDHDC